MSTCLTTALNIITAGGAVAAAVGVWVAYRQLKAIEITLQDSRRWNKVISAFNIIPNREELNSIEEELNNSLVNLVDRTTPISQAELIEIFKPENARIKILLKNYLNELESYCTAINVGAVCDETAKRKYSYKITRHFLELKPYIEKIRIDHNAPQLFAEIEQVVTKWAAQPDKKATY